MHGFILLGLSGDVMGTVGTLPALLGLKLIAASPQACSRVSSLFVG